MVQRGCNSDLSPDDYVTCSITTNGTCHSCSGDNCNIKIAPQSCFSCDSDSDEFCSTAPYLAESKYCNRYYEQCYTAIQNSSVYRGCFHTDLADEQLCNGNSNNDGSGNACHTCSGDNCNRESVEPNMCYACNSSMDSNCATSPNATMLVQCPSSVMSGCFHSIDGNGMYKNRIS